MTEDEATARVAELHKAIKRAGGVVSQADLARHWGISTVRVAELVTKPGFPDAVLTIGRSRVFALAQVDAWRAARAS